MNVVAFNGSPHREGVVYHALLIMKEELERGGIETEIVQVGGENIRGCVDCGGCRRPPFQCVFNDDPVNTCRDKVNAADGIILGSPVYYGGIAGTFKSFLDRLFFPGTRLRCKVGAVVTSLRRSGGVSTFQQLTNYLNLAQVVITPSVYWAVIHGNTPREFEEDREGLQITRITGRNMAWLIKTLAAGGKEVPLPEELRRERTNFIR
ncbi:MAG: flavodoxin family protein [Treponema sp.]|jgi:multimeric flavodoxin WrbA|nr:flavodoxin family protein [Treponema sp.]